MLVERYRLYTRLFFGALWVLLCYGFVRDEFIHQLAGIRPFFNLLCDCVFLFLGLITIRARRDIVMAVSLILIALWSKYLNHQGVAEWMNGMRDYIGLLFTIPFIRYMMSREDYGRRFTKSMDKQLFIFLCLQTICVTWQFLRYGAGDAGGGSMGYGHSGVVSTLIYVISFYLITKKWNPEESYFRNLWINRVYVILLFPTFLNETKISFVFMLAYFGLLMKIDRRFMLRLVMAIPLAIIGFVVMGIVYLNVTGQSAERLLSEKYYTDYFFGEDIHDLAYLSVLVEEEEIETDNLWVVDLPRIGRFVFIPEALATTGGGMWFGAGPGQFKGKSYFSSTSFSRKFAWLLNGSVPLVFAWMIQLGFVGVVWFFVNLVTIVFTRNSSPMARNLRFFLIVVFLPILIYQDQFSLVYYCAIVFYICMEGMQPQFQFKQEEQL